MAYAQIPISFCTTEVSVIIMIVTRGRTYAVANHVVVSIAGSDVIIRKWS